MAEENKEPLTDEVVTYEPSGPSGNAWAIMAATAAALKRNGHAAKVAEYQRRAMAGDYRNLLAQTRRYVNLVEI